MNIKNRQMRAYQAKHRGTKNSYATQFENATIVLAWLDGSLSEGQVAKVLGVDRLDARDLRERLVARGVELGGALLAKTKLR